MGMLTFREHIEVGIRLSEAPPMPPRRQSWCELSTAIRYLENDNDVRVLIWSKKQESRIWSLLLREWVWASHATVSVLSKSRNISRVNL